MTAVIFNYIIIVCVYIETLEKASVRRYDDDTNTPDTCLTQCGAFSDCGEMRVTLQMVYLISLPDYTSKHAFSLVGPM